jgi:helicase
MIRGAFIGIDRHADPEIRDLTGAARDARALWSLFADSVQGFDAELLTDAAASRAAVLAALDHSLGGAGEEDIVLLGFAGHGTPDHRLVLADSAIDRLADTSISMADVAERFAASRAKAVLLFLDCCFSGGAPARVLNAGLVARDVAVPLGQIGGKGRILFAASAPDEEALEDPRSRHGLFTAAVIDALVSEGGAELNVLHLVWQVTAAVRGNAERMGYVQTPAMFGHVEGEMLLPPGRRGAHYYRFFPELAPIAATGEFAQLLGFGIPANVIAAWRARYPGLNKLQCQAINDHGVLAGNSLLVVAPTSAGKTFIGELAAIRAVSEGRRAIFLLPYKALVNEKYEDFSALYGEQAGLRVVRCSGDWQDQVGAVLNGKYDIAFFTYEKFLALSVAFPHLLHQLGLVVLDEAQFLTDEGRGMTVELLLTALLSAKARGVAPQLVALSAVIGNTNRLEQWLGCGLLATDERPVPLTSGVIDRSGVWRFRKEDGESALERLLEPGQIQQRRAKPSSQDVIVPLVRTLAARGEKLIIFRSGRGPSAGCAQYLAAELGLPPARAVIDSLPEGDLSAMSGRLREALAGGVAFHTSDLSREERLAVEQGFRARDGGIAVLVATSTVAAGINTPASTVVIVETSFAGPEPKPYSVAQFRNMAGRAGRLGYEAEGKAIAIADTGYERDALFRTYVEGVPEPMRSSFDARNPGTWILRLLTQVRHVPHDAVTDLVANTYGGFLATLRDSDWRETMRGRVEDLLARMIRDGLVDEEAGSLSLSILGRACGESPLSLDSAMRLIEMLQRIEGPATLDQLLALSEALHERDAAYTPQVRHGEPKWLAIAAARFGHRLVRLLSLRAESDRAHYARCKRALIIADWTGGRSIAEIEQDYSLNGFVAVRAGDIRGFADGTRFLFDAVLRIAAILFGEGFEPEAKAAMLKRLELGLPEDALALSDLPVTLGRGDVMALREAGLTTREQLHDAGEARLTALIGRSGERLFAALNDGRDA